MQSFLRYLHASVAPQAAPPQADPTPPTEPTKPHRKYSFQKYLTSCLETVRQRKPKPELIPKKPTITIICDPPATITNSPLFRWAGGKARMIRNYVTLLPEKIHTYIEPFLGGGAMFLYIKENYPELENVTLNDINSEIISIYKEVRDHHYEFRLILKEFEKEFLPLDAIDRKDYYYQVRGNL